MSLPEGTKALELFCGIGGFTAAASDGVEVVGALDNSMHVLQVYDLNHPGGATRQINLEFIDDATLAAYGADFWWMSPPCQPYTVRGHQNDLDDRRAKSLVHLLGALSRLRPERVAMENVAGFWDSRARALMHDTLEGAGYAVHDFILCPTTLGIPNKRERYYLVASRTGLSGHTIEPRPMHPLAGYLDEVADEALFIDDALVDKHGPGMRILAREDAARPDTVSNCFTGAYGRTFRFSGSFLREADGRTRYFSTAEIARLLGFGDAFRVPDAFTQRQANKYLGNSLSVHAVREVIRFF